MHLRDAEYAVSMSNGFQDLITDPLGKDHRTFGMTGGTEGAGDRMMLIKDFVVCRYP